MEIPELLAEVPPDFLLHLEPKRDSDRIVGTLEDLGPDTRASFHALCYFNEQLKALTAAHREEHQQPGFDPQGGACQRHADASDELQEKILTLRAFITPTIFAQFGIQENETLGFRAEGIVAFPSPEPQFPVGMAIIVIGPGELAESDVSPNS